MDVCSPLETHLRLSSLFPSNRSSLEQSTTPVACLDHLLLDTSTPDKARVARKPDPIHHTRIEPSSSRPDATRIPLSASNSLGHFPQTSTKTTECLPSATPLSPATPWATSPSARTGPNKRPVSWSFSALSSSSAVV